MTENMTFSLGNIALIDKIDSETDFFESVLGGIGVGADHSYQPWNCLSATSWINRYRSTRYWIFPRMNLWSYSGSRIGVCIGFWRESERISR